MSPNFSFLPEHVAIAVSGGADSVAALHLICRHRDITPNLKSVTVLHFHHGLRNESDEEYLFTETLAEQYQCTFIGGRTEIPLRQSSGNMQHRAREARYTFFAKACESLNIHHVVTAHHMNDKAETTLLRLLAGSGTEGISGIKPVSDIYGLTILRPFLTVSKEYLRRVIEDNRLTFREDASNQQRRYARTRVRHFLHNEPPHTIKHLSSAADSLAVDADYIHQQVVRTTDRSVTFHSPGYHTIHRDLFCEHQAILHRVFTQIQYHQDSFKGKRVRSSTVLSVIEQAQAAISCASPTTIPLGSYLLKYMPDREHFIYIKDASRVEHRQVITKDNHSIIEYKRFSLTIRLPIKGALMSIKQAAQHCTHSIDYGMIRNSLNCSPDITDTLPIILHLDNHVTLPHIFKDRLLTHDHLPLSYTYMTYVPKHTLPFGKTADDLQGS